MSGARDIEDRAARWLIRREEPEWSPEDQAALDAWLEESMAYKAAYWRLEYGWREADRIGALGHGANVEQAPRPSRFARWWKPIAIAASLLVTAGLGMTEFRLISSKAVVAPAQFDTPVGRQKVISLTDGSKIELNTATVMRVAVTDKTRQVWLDRGEAYFEVAHIASRPFVVHAGSKNVTVLGTKFSVRRDDDKVTVSVVQGRVRVEDAVLGQASRSSVITAGDVAIAIGSSTLLAPKSESRVESALAWRNGMLNFDQVTLAEAAAEFNRYNTRRIIVTDPQAANIRIGGTFQTSNIDAFARLLHDAYGLRVADDPDGVKISS